MLVTVTIEAFQQHIANTIHCRARCGILPENCNEKAKNFSRSESRTHRTICGAQLELLPSAKHESVHAFHQISESCQPKKTSDSDDSAEQIQP